MKIQMEFISSDVLKDMLGGDKIEFILKKIKGNKILVLDGGLSPLEETRLIEETMSKINKSFRGIEISTLRDKVDGGIKNKLIKFLGGQTGGLTVIGPSKLVKKIKKEPQKILLFAEKR